MDPLTSAPPSPGFFDQLLGTAVSAGTQWVQNQVTPPTVAPAPPGAPSPSSVQSPGAGFSFASPAGLLLLAAAGAALFLFVRR